jgi:hypothetical protein
MTTRVGNLMGRCQGSTWTSGDPWSRVPPPERPRQNPINTEGAMPAAIILSDAPLAPLRQILETRHPAVTDDRRRRRDVLQRKQAMSGRLLRASI